jgi:hypothetical protein
MPMRIRRKVLGLALPILVGLVALVPAAPAGAAVVRLTATLDGASEVPGPGDMDGAGAADVRVNVRQRWVCYVVVVRGIDLPAAAAHIHRGVASVAGPVKVTLKAPKEVGSSGFGLSTGCVEDVRKKLLRKIKNTPERFYVNVHNEAFPDGAVRGQLG